MLLGTTQVISSLAGTSSIVTADLLVKTIGYTTHGIFFVGKKLFQSTNHVNIVELQELEKDIDLLKTIEIYDVWIREILEKNKLDIESSDAIKITIQSISDILQTLHKILQSIENKLESHKSKWFQNWRNLYFSGEVEQLKYNKKILDNRFDILQKIHISKFYA
jgi:hypothetical protein